MPLREAVRLIACIRFGAESVHPLDLEVAEDAMMAIPSVRVSKESEEYEDIAYRHAIPVKVRLSGAGLPQRAVPVLKHGVVMAETRPRKPTPCYRLDDIAEPDIVVRRDRTSLRGDGQADRPAIDNGRRKATRTAIKPFSAEHNPHWVGANLAPDALELADYKGAALIPRLAPRRSNSGCNGFPFSLPDFSGSKFHVQDDEQNRLPRVRELDRAEALRFP